VKLGALVSRSNVGVERDAPFDRTGFNTVSTLERRSSDVCSALLVEDSTDLMNLASAGSMVVTGICRRAPTAYSRMLAQQQNKKLKNPSTSILMALYRAWMRKSSPNKGPRTKNRADELPGEVGLTRPTLFGGAA
jgi:hypothetical protein